MTRGAQMKKNIKIAISGKSGCGNTTVSRLLADTLGLRFINFTFRSIAAEKNMTLEDVLEKSRADDSWDKEVDARQVAMARDGGAATGCVLGSRLAIWMLDDADLKVYLRASARTRVARIVNREGGGLDAVARFTEERDRQDTARYLRIYGINNDNYQFADLIIDVDAISPEQISERIIEHLKNRLS